MDSFVLPVFLSLSQYILYKIVTEEETVGVCSGGATGVTGGDLSHPTSRQDQFSNSSKFDKKCFGREGPLARCVNRCGNQIASQFQEVAPKISQSAMASQAPGCVVGQRPQDDKTVGRPEALLVTLDLFLIKTLGFASGL